MRDMLTSMGKSFIAAAFCELQDMAKANEPLRLDFSEHLDINNVCHTRAFVLAIADGIVTLKDMPTGNTPSPRSWC